MSKKISDKEMYQRLGLEVLHTRLGKIRAELVLISQLSFREMFKAREFVAEKEAVLQDIENIEHVLAEIKRSLGRA